MHKHTGLFVGGVSLVAVAAGAWVYAQAPALTGVSAVAVALLCGLAVMAELLVLIVSGSATGSIAFIPYLAAALVVPHWTSLAAVTVVKALTELQLRRGIKAVFNVAQHALTFAVAVLVYRWAGGHSLTEFSGSTLLSTTMAMGGAALIAFAASFVTNSIVVTGVIALSTQRPVSAVWRETFLSAIGLDLLASPLIFVFAWVYVFAGPLAAATLWIPILGLRQVQKANLQLEQTNRELLELMVKSIEARDPYTSGHSRRVQHYATTIARALGMKEREVERIGQAALLHDVGKIHEKYAPILRKPDRLSPEEWRIMQEHPADGAGLIATMSGLKTLVPAIRHHHENWDGTGYPDGLAGELIPVASRVIMFADTIDAMTSERPYRKPLSPDQVRAEIVRCRGRQFDPELADRLLSSPMWAKLFAPTVIVSSTDARLKVVRSSSASEWSQVGT